jgi:hypothetical protein
MKENLLIAEIRRIADKAIKPRILREITPHITLKKKIKYRSILK